MSSNTETTEVLFARYGPRYRIYVTVVALLGTISAIVTTTTVNVALPDIMGSFGIGLLKQSRCERKPVSHGIATSPCSSR